MRKKWIVKLMIVFLIAAFILGQSLLPRPQSKQESLAVQSWIEPFLELFVGPGNVTQRLVRKIAHVVEYTVLGLSLGILFWERKRWYLWGALVGLALGAVDETVQIFTGRGPALTDVGIDFCGVVLGLLLCLLLRAVYRKWRQKKRDRDGAE